jgi:uncharacterized protein YuzE
MAIRVTHDAEADAAYVYLAEDNETPVAETRELVPDTVFADYAADGSLIGIEFLWVSDGVLLDSVPRAEEVGRAFQDAGIAIRLRVL